MTPLDDQQQAARDWFESLRTRICTAFEAIEREAGSDAAFEFTSWDREDAGMWEVRGDTQKHTVSRLMCWVAVERMMRTARQRGLPGELARWAEVRDEIYRRIMDDSWDEELGSFVSAMVQADVLGIPVATVLLDVGPPGHGAQSLSAALPDLHFAEQP